jgi:hypothetical protein
VDPDPDPGRAKMTHKSKKKIRKFMFWSAECSLLTSDPDPHVFGPPGSGSISQRYGYGSRSFYQQVKIVRKTLIPTVL